MAGLWYRVGTISVTNGSKKITGFGTQWATAVIKPKKGHTVHAPDGRQYELDYVESDTVMYIVTTYAGVTATGQAYAIDITRSDTIPAFSRDLAAFTAYAQGQYDSWQQVLTGTGIVTLTAPDGQQIQVPALSAMQQTSASLKALQALAPAKDKLPVFNGPTSAELITLTAFMRTLLDDPDAATALGTLGGYARSGGAITGDFWRASGATRYGLVDSLGTHGDAKPCLVLLAKKYTGSMLDKTGFTGRIMFNRGGATAGMQTDFVDLSVSVAYTSNNTRLIRRSTGTVATLKIVEVTHNAEVYYALYRSATSAADVVLTGHAYDSTLPLLIADATAYTVTDVVTVEEDYHRGNILGTVSQSSGIPTGAIIESGANANGEYIKFADGTMICKLAYDKTITTSPVGSIFYASLVGVNKPVAFAGASYDWGSPVYKAGNATGPCWIGNSGSGMTSGQWNLDALFAMASTNAPRTFLLFAIGRWY